MWEMFLSEQYIRLSLFIPSEAEASAPASRDMPSSTSNGRKTKILMKSNNPYKKVIYVVFGTHF